MESMFKYRRKETRVTTNDTLYSKTMAYTKVMYYTYFDSNNFYRQLVKLNV